MFTGIVEGTGEITEVTDDQDGRRLRVRAGLDDLHHGQSIAVSGVCLTVETFGADWFEVFLSRETLERTYLGELEPGDAVNVERALPADGRLDGHIVQGHVDATAAVTAIERLDDEAANDAGREADADGGYGGDWAFRFSVPEALSRYLVEKGSVTVDGISLTVAAREGAEFGVAIIPATYDLTTLSEKAVGDPVHLEVDVVAKYVERLLAADADVTASQTPYRE